MAIIFITLVFLLQSLTAHAMTGASYEAFNSPEKGFELANELTANGADVIYHAAGVTGDGVIKAASEGSFLAIGVDSNQNGQAPGHVLISMIKRMDVALFLALQQNASETWQPGIRHLGLRESGVDWALDTHNIQLITEKMQLAMEDISFNIIAKLIDVDSYNRMGT